MSGIIEKSRRHGEIPIVDPESKRYRFFNNSNFYLVAVYYVTGMVHVDLI